MLTNWGETAIGQSQRISPERRKLIPLLGWVAENPFNGVRVVVDANDEILTAGDDQRIIGFAIGIGVHMKPISGSGFNKLSGIIAAGGHSSADNVGQIPHL